jgi:hypothetical protein
VEVHIDDLHLWAPVGLPEKTGAPDEGTQGLLLHLEGSGNGLGFPAEFVGSRTYDQLFGFHRAPAAMSIVASVAPV